MNAPGAFPDAHPETLPDPHRRWLEQAVERFAANPALAGVVMAGSAGTDTMDEYSDLDLVLGIESDAVDEVMAEREAVAASLGPLLVGFTGEHVGEPRLLICLYGPPLLHVDLKFVDIGEIGERIGPVRILFDRDGRVRERVRDTPPTPVTADRQWIEDRFWPWIHYIAGKVARGELMEAVDGLGMLRLLALGPLVLASRDAVPTGVRRVERDAPDHLPALYRTVARPDPDSCRAALDAAVSLYRALREEAEPLDPVERRKAAEAAVVEYLEGV